MPHLLLAARVTALVAAVALAGTGLFTFAAIVHAGPRNVAREAVDPGAFECGRVGDYDAWGTRAADQPCEVRDLGAYDD